MTIQIKIYNIVGELVYEYEGGTDNGKWTWNLVNKDNQKNSNWDIYLCVEGEK